MESSKTNPAEDLAYIRQIINDSKNIIIDNGMGFIIWGVLVVIGLTITYAKIQFEWLIDTRIVWAVLIGAGWLYTSFDVFRETKKRKVSTFAGKIMGALWFSTGIAASIVGFVGMFTGAYNGAYICPLISCILGISYFVSGVLYNYSWIYVVAFFWWVGALVMFIFPGLHMFLIMTFMMIFLQIVPGIVLYNKSKSELVVE